MPRGRPRGEGGYGLSVDKPRGRTSAYAYFVQTCREEHKRLHPDENVEFQFSRQCSESWQTMGDVEKKKFYEMAERDRERYAAEMNQYRVAGGGGGRRRRQRKAPKDPNKPKRALSAFFYYANDERAKVRAANPDFSVGEVAKELGRQWNELTEGEKSKYEKLAEEDRARYDREMTIYKSGGSPLKKMKVAESNGHSLDHDENDIDDMEDGSDEENGIA